MAEGESPFSYLNDHLGSPIRLMGEQEETLAYDEFGVPTVQSTQNGNGSLNNPFGFTGYQMDDVSGLYFAQARYYEPSVGRMVSEDIVRSISNVMPNGQKIIDPLSLNLYTYCINNPILLIDPSGFTYYIFYDIEFEDQATCAKKYSGYGDDVEMILVKDFASFRKGWNLMDDSGGYIDSVSMFLHSGDPRCLYLNEDNKQIITYEGDKTPSGYGAIYLGDRRQLKKKKIDTLDLYVCNAGNLDYYNEGGNGTSDNLAVAFMRLHDIKHVTAWDGSLSFTKIPFTDIYGARLSMDQSGFYRSVAEINFLFLTWKRSPVGLINYYIGKDEKVKWLRQYD